MKCMNFKLLMTKILQNEIKNFRFISWNFINPMEMKTESSLPYYKSIQRFLNVYRRQNSAVCFNGWHGYMTKIQD